MSDTDKTKPGWVKLRQNPQLRVEHHDHRFQAECDLAFRKFEIYSAPGYWCNYWHVSGARGFYPRASRVEHRYRNEENGRERTKLRAVCMELRKLARANSDLPDVQSFPHRHRVLWDI